VASSSAAAPAAPAAQAATSSGNYLDSFSPKSNAPAKSYGLSSYKPGQAVPQSNGFANQVASSSAAAPAAPAAQAATSSGNYLDSFSPKSNAPAKSYGISSFKPSSAPKAGSSYLDAMAGGGASSQGYAAPAASAPPAQAQAANTGSYMDALSPKSTAPAKSYGLSSYKPR
jgi:hypothetical protein